MREAYTVQIVSRCVLGARRTEAQRMLLVEEVQLLQGLAQSFKQHSDDTDTTVRIFKTPQEER